MTHLFVPSGQWTNTVVPQEICDKCGGLSGEKQHNHVLPETPEDARRIDERRLGEKART